MKTGTSAIERRKEQKERKNLDESFQVSSLYSAAAGMFVKRFASDGSVDACRRESHYRRLAEGGQTHDQGLLGVAARQTNNAKHRLHVRVNNLKHRMCHALAIPYEREKRLDMQS